MQKTTSSDRMHNLCMPEKMGVLVEKRNSFLVSLIEMGSFFSSLLLVGEIVPASNGCRIY